MKIYIVVTDVVIDVTYSRKVLIHVLSYDFYDMTLSTGKQRRHMINFDTERATGKCFGGGIFYFTLTIFRACVLWHCTYTYILTLVKESTQN